MDAAVAAAKAAFPAWRATPVVERARAMFAFKNRLEEHFDEIARIVTTEHGKTLDESRGSVRRGIEAVEVACGMPSMMMGYGLEDIARGIDCDVHRQPMGVFAAIAPFNFPAMVPLWFLPFAVATGNTFVVKPSELVPLSQKRMHELLAECVPPGVVNLVNGGVDVVNGLCEHPDVRGVSFVGSTPVAKHVYRTASHAGKRVQALGGAKNFIVVMPDAEPRQVDRHRLGVLLRLRGRALPRGLGRRDGRRRAPARRRPRAPRRRREGDPRRRRPRAGRHDGARHPRGARGTRVLSYVEKGLAEGAELVLDGRGHTVKGRESGFFLGPSIFDRVSPKSSIGREEIFGPVLSLMNVPDLPAALALLHDASAGERDLHLHGRAASRRGRSRRRRRPRWSA